MSERKQGFWIIRFAWLALITILAATASFKGPLPLDARTNLPLQATDAHFDWPLAAIAIEPLTAPAAIIVGAPNYVVAGSAAFLWLAVIVVIACGYRLLLRRRKRPAYRLLAEACGAGLIAMLVAALYLAFAILVPLPSWRLHVSDPEIVVADLHSHTLLSYDSFASCRSNLAYHRGHGYSVVAVTEHPPEEDRAPPPPCANARGKLPEVVTGMELASAREKYLLLLGIPAGFPPYRLYERRQSEHYGEGLPALIEAVHLAGGAVIALSFNLRENDLQPLADAGVDGFEIANFGHPKLPDAMKVALVAVQRSQHVALIAVSDWHGWGGFARTWTLIRPRASPSDTRSGQVLEVLRAHDVDAVTPVIYHQFGQPTLLAGAVVPLVETFKYARELTPMRLASWWLWIAAIGASAMWLRRRGFKPTPSFAGGAMLLLGAGFLVRGAGLIADWAAGAPYWFPLRIAGICCGLGAVALLIAFLLLARRRCAPE
jgi:histidinol phosphatase-like PHP family hydrolase